MIVELKMSSPCLLSGENERIVGIVSYLRSVERGAVVAYGWRR